ncbi:MAG: SLC13 family permease, partial [Bacillota bacterium]
MKSVETAEGIGVMGCRYARTGEVFHPKVKQRGGKSMFQENAWLAIGIFVLAYILIITEKIHRTKIALAGAALLLLCKVMPQAAGIAKVDFNTLGLLIGMMIIVAIARQTGIFQYLAVKAAKMVQGEPVKIMLVFFALTAIASAFLDNVTTVLLLTGVTFAITDILEINPIPFLIGEVLASNIGGTATLIGDPPNIMIGSAAGLGFNDFIINLALPNILIGMVTCWLLYLIYRKELRVEPEKRRKVMALDEQEFLTDTVLLRKSLAVLALVI